MRAGATSVGELACMAGSYNRVERDFCRGSPASMRDRRRGRGCWADTGSARCRYAARIRSKRQSHR